MANYTKPEGWVESPFWEAYAQSFSEDGSEQQIAAALSQSAPEEWLNKFFADNRLDKMSESWRNQNAKNYIPNPASRPVSRFKDKGQVLSTYSQTLQKRLADNFNKNQKSYADRGKANLRDQSQQVLEDEQRAIDENMNARGLLRSGKRSSARASAAAQKAGELGAATTQFEQDLADTGRSINNASFASDINSLLQQQDLNSIASGAFYNKLENDIGNTAGMIQGLGAAGAGGGSFTGSMLARNKKAS